MRGSSQSPPALGTGARRGSRDKLEKESQMLQSESKIKTGGAYHTYSNFANTSMNDKKFTSYDRMQAKNVRAQEPGYAIAS